MMFEQRLVRLSQSTKYPAYSKLMSCYLDILIINSVCRFSTSNTCEVRKFELIGKIYYLEDGDPMAIQL